MLISLTSATFEITGSLQDTKPLSVSHYQVCRWNILMDWEAELPLLDTRKPFQKTEVTDASRPRAPKQLSQEHTIFLNLCQASTTHFSTVKCFLWKKTDILSFHFQNWLFYHTIRKCKFSFPLWETFLLQATSVFDTNTLFYITSKPSKDGNAAPARILQLQGSQSILHFISDAITISLSKIIKFDFSSD